MLGFNFYPKSPRYIEKDACAEITSVLKKEYQQVKLVGVFVNSPVDEIKDILQICSLELAQLHGDESAEMLQALEGKSFKAFRGKIDNELILNSAPAFLLDAQVKDVYGGSGVKADWEYASELARQYSFLLAGGLTPENVSDAVERVKPWGVDVASGVESSPGVKDEAKMVQFVKAVKSASSDR
jgi:phosphoribosylanthranilate isomerase